MSYPKSSFGLFTPASALDAPADAMRTGLEFWTMLCEAQSVIAMRTLGQFGFWAVTPSENQRMVTEKSDVFLEAANAAFAAAQAGKRPDEVLSAAVKPLGRKTRSNMKRLTKRGPGLPK
jgi:hypothetical protein